MRTQIWKLPGVGLLLFGVLTADDQHHHDLGVVHFPVSCTSAAQKTFERGVALLHSFWYDEAEKTFTEAARADPACAMAHWGAAMSFYHPIWAPPTPEDLKKGRAALEKSEIGARENAAGARLLSRRSKSFTKTRTKRFISREPLPGGKRCSSFRRVIRKIGKPPFSMRSR